MFCTGYHLSLPEHKLGMDNIILQGRWQGCLSLLVSDANWLKQNVLLSCAEELVTKHVKNGAVVGLGTGVLVISRAAEPCAVHLRLHSDQNHAQRQI